MILEFLVHTFLFPKLQSFSIRPAEFLTLKPQAGQTLPTFDDVPKRLPSDVLDVEITAKSAIAVDAKTGLIMYGKNTREQRSIASITKLMTAIVFLEQQPDLKRMITIQSGDRHEGGMISFNIGEKMTLADVLNAALVASDNDAAYILSRSTKLSVTDFIAAMNTKASALGMEQTSFVDPTGLNKKNVSTAADLVRLIEAAIAVPEIQTATTHRSFTAQVLGLDDNTREVKLYTTDRLLQGGYLEVIGGKTGYLPESGYCLAAKVKNKSGQEEFIVVLGSATLPDRFQNLKALDYFTTKTYK